jgi:hypothetical protein
VQTGSPRLPENRNENRNDNRNKRYEISDEAMTNRYENKNKKIKPR